MGPIAGLIGELDPHRSEDRPLQGEPDPVAVGVVGRLGDG